MAKETKAQKEAREAAEAAAANQSTPPEAGTQSVPPAAANSDQGKALVDASPKKAVEQATPGRIVHFFREVNSGNGTTLQLLPAIVIGPAAKESNLPENSMDLGVHSRAGYETRFGVMYSDEPKAGRWSWPKR